MIQILTIETFTQVSENIMERISSSNPKSGFNNPVNLIFKSFLIFSHFECCSVVLVGYVSLTLDRKSTSICARPSFTS